MDIYIGLAVGVAAVFALYVLSQKKRRIKNPRLGFLDLTGGAADPLLREDRDALTEIFDLIEVSSDKVPKCDVLFLYASLGNGGELQGTERYLRATIRDSGAKVVVVASENPSPPRMMGRPVYGYANLVITLSRKGPLFSAFFHRLFSAMKKGTMMPVAWNRLAPQVPGDEHADCPETFFICELGGISFS